MKRLLSLLLVLVLVLGAVPMTALAANPFTDVPQNQWYYADIDSAYQNGLINGKTPTLYMPDDFLTYAEAVKLAAAMNQRYTTGAVTLQNGNPWYQTYVDYCKTKGIIYVDYAWNQNATRAGYMDIFANALPSSAMQEINNIPDGSIPDVPMSHPQADAIYKLYRVGILQGNDLQHNCNPGANIKRSEVAAILTRMMDSSKRISFSMDAEALRFTKQPVSVSGNPGETVYLSVEAAGGKTPYQYQWMIATDGSRKNWSNVSRGNGPTLSIALSDSRLTPAYRCKVTDGNGDSIYSELAEVSVTKELKIDTQPVGGTVKPGDTMRPFVEVSGGKTPYAYQWEAHNGGSSWIKISGCTAASMSMVVGESAVGEDLIYRCRITDADGKVIVSDAAVFEVIEDAAPLTITRNPADVTLKAGEEATMGVEVTGGKAPYSYQWETYYNRRWIPFTNATGATIRYVAPDNIAAADSAMFHCTVTDANGSTVTSTAATVTVVPNAALKITDQPNSVYAYEGEAPEFEIEVTGGKAPYQFRWYIGTEGGANTVDGEWGIQTYSDSANGYSVMQVTVNDAFEYSSQDRCFFYCIVTDANGNHVTSDYFDITVR